MECLVSSNGVNQWEYRTTVALLVYVKANTVIRWKCKSDRNNSQMYSFNQGKCQLQGINLKHNVFISQAERLYYAFSGGRIIKRA